MKRGEVWWVEFDPSTGSEIRKTRSAIIVSNDIANIHLVRVVVVPLTSSVSKLYPGEALITVAGKQSKAMTDQIMAADKSRLKSRLGTVAAAEMEAVDAAMMLHLGLAR
jgi:mRNA interferase MazF